MNIPKKLVFILSAVVLGVVIIAIALPSILHNRGLHPDDDSGLVFDMSGKKALIVTTSHGTLRRKHR